MTDAAAPAAAIARSVVAPAQAGEPPLVVDLDGCLIRTDLLVETLVDVLRRDARVALRLPAWLLAGRARLKHELALRARLDAGALPYHAALLAFLRDEQARGRRLVLATASHRSLADAVAAHLGLFDEVIATSDDHNVKGAAKAAVLVARFGERGFDYAGDAPADVAVWRRARGAVAVGLSPRRLRRVPVPVARAFAPAGSIGRAAWRAVRPHQWLKNLLVFVPVLSAHAWTDASAVAAALAAFVALGLCASGGYLANDLFDLASDRAHPRKRQRPVASGALPLPLVAASAPLLALAGVTLGTLVDRELGAVLVLYLAATLAYSWLLKRYMLVDTMTLAGLYTLRLVAGGAAADVPLSFWLLAFSMFLFLSLGMVKRYAELEMVESLSRAVTRGRDYRVTDRALLGTMGVASGYVAVLVFALYLQTPAVLDGYLRPHAMWLLCPLLLYWISRMWIKAARGEMHDDPLVFALRDRASRLLLGVIAAIVLVAGPL